MYSCNHCDGVFKTIRGLNGHKRMHGPSKGGYTQDRSTKHPKTYNCKHCGEESKWLLSKKNVFCSRKCQAAHEWESVAKVDIENGTKTLTSVAQLVRYVTERDGYKCNCCGISTWLDNPITLDLDHIDGDRSNNIPFNLRLLCPNCHRQTPTWGNKKRD